MENVGPPTKRPRYSEELKPSSSMQSRSKKHWLCNELVCEMCPNIQAMKTSNQIQLTARNMRTYLAPRFRKKLIYLDAIKFIKSMVESDKKVRIQVYQVVQGNNCGPADDVIFQQQHLVVQQPSSIEVEGTQYEIITNHLHIQMSEGKKNHSVCFHILDDQFVQTHLLYFYRLIAPLLQPIKFNMNRRPNMLRFLRTQSNCIDWLKLSVDQFIAAPVNAELAKYNNLQILAGEATIAEFSRPFIQWLTSNKNGKPKLCILPEWLTSVQAMMPMLKEIKAEFSQDATGKHPFGVYFKLLKPAAGKPLIEFTLGNERTEEVLELRFIDFHSGNLKYALIRDSVDHKAISCQRIEFDKMTTTELIRETIA